MHVFTNEFLALLPAAQANSLLQLSAAEVLQLVEQCKPVVQKTSTLRGAEGESLVLEYLQKVLVGYKIEQVNSTARSGDIVVTKIENNLKLMIDVKNYNNNVPTKEVDKFIRDIEYKNYDTAVLLSLNTRVTGYRSIAFDTFRTPQRTVHFAVVSSSSQAILVEIIETLFAMCELHTINVVDCNWMVERFNDLEAVARKMGETRKTLTQSILQLQSMLNVATEDIIHIELDACRIISELRSGIKSETYTPVAQLGDLKAYTSVVVGSCTSYKLSTDQKKIKCVAGKLDIQIALMKSVADQIEIVGVDTNVAYSTVPMCQRWNYSPANRCLSTTIEATTLDALLSILAPQVDVGR